MPDNAPIHVPATFDDLPDDTRHLYRCAFCGVQHMHAVHMDWQHGSTWCSVCRRLVNNEAWLEVEA